MIHRLWYVTTTSNGVMAAPTCTGEALFDEEWWVQWLEHMVDIDYDTIFYVTVDSLDVW